MVSLDLAHAILGVRASPFFLGMRADSQDRMDQGISVTAKDGNLVEPAAALVVSSGRQPLSATPEISAAKVARLDIEKATLVR